MLDSKSSDIQSKLLSVSSLSGGQMSWAASGQEKPRGFIQSQLCYQRCSSEIRYSTKHPRTAADALHWENEVGAAANSLKQHNAYNTQRWQTEPCGPAMQCSNTNTANISGIVQMKFNLKLFQGILHNYTYNFSVNLSWMWTAWSICSMKSQLASPNLGSQQETASANIFTSIIWHIYKWNRICNERKGRGILCIGTDHLLRPRICIEEVNKDFTLILMHIPGHNMHNYLTKGILNHLKQKYFDFVLFFFNYVPLMQPFLLKVLFSLKKRKKKRNEILLTPILTLFLTLKKAKTTKQGTKICSSSHSWTAKKLKAYYKFKNNNWELQHPKHTLSFMNII